MVRKLAATVLLWLWTSAALAGVSCSVPFTFVPGALADANQVNANYAALVACLLNAAGAGANNDITALNALTTPITPAAGGSTLYVGGTSTGSANAQVVASAQPLGFALTRGLSILFTAGFTNTAAVQININGTGLTNLFRQSPSGPQAMTGGEIITNDLVWAVYDGTQFQLINSGAQYGGFGPLVSLASAATTDLGTVPTHNVNITGVASITAFGSTASLTYPVYNLTFSGVLTLTYNATSLILPSAANITTAANDTAEALYLGSGNWQIMSYRRANGTSVVSPTPLCGFSGLSIANGASNSIINWSWNSSVLLNPVGNIPVFSTAKSGTLNITTVGAGGMDAAGLGANTFVSMYAIYNGSVWNAVGSTNLPSVGPTPMPAGYTFLCYMGAIKTNAGINLYGTLISGADAVYVVGGANLATALPQIDSGTPKGSNCNVAGTTYVTETVRGSAGAGVWMPSTATIGRFVASLAASTTALAANSTYVGTSAAGGQAFQASGTPGSTTVAILMESNAVFWCNTGAAAALFQLGWHDQVNAN